MAKKYYCNKCGKQMDSWDIQHHFSITKRLGYGSKYDGEVLNLDICCDCMDEIIDACIISPISPRSSDEDDIPPWEHV